MLPIPPAYDGRSLVNLVAEIERRAVGSAHSRALDTDLAAHIPPRASTVLAVFDGLGTAQVAHPSASAIRGSLAASIDAPFPTTTTVSLATIATGMTPAEHGLIGYQLWLPELDVVANTIKWTTLWGEPLNFQTRTFLPSPNLWERLAHGGVEPITVQPAPFADTDLTRLLYRGCRFEGVTTLAEQIDATVQLAAVPDRLILVYVNLVDFAAHVYGQQAEEYTEAVATVDTMWSSLVHRLPPDVALVGTADHGHVDFPPHHQVKLSKAMHRDRTLYGDGRVMFVRGEGASLANDLPARWVERIKMQHWWGDPNHLKTFEGRLPDGVLVADDGYLLLHKHSDDRMIGNHGGLTEAERAIPLLVR